MSINRAAITRSGTYSITIQGSIRIQRRQNLRRSTICPRSCCRRRYQRLRMGSNWGCKPICCPSCASRERGGCTDLRLPGCLWDFTAWTKAGGGGRRLRRRANGGKSGLAPTCHEGVTQSGLRLHTPFRIPDKTFRNEIDKFFIITTEDLLQCLCTWSASTALRIDDSSRDSVRI